MGRLASSMPRVRAILDGAHEHWQDLELPEETFVAFLETRVGDDDPVTDLEALQAADLYLACGCAEGREDFIRRLESTYGAALARRIDRYAKDEQSRDDFAQTVREKLFVGHGSPKICDYAGTGPLAIWLAIMAERTFMDLLRGRDRAAKRVREHHASPASDLERGLQDPELEYLKERYRLQFRDAFGRAVAQLEARERNVMRLNLVHQLTHKQIATTYGVHRVTVTRWMEVARARILELTTTILRDELDVEDSELQSILRLIESRMDVTLSRVLGEPDQGE